MTTAGATIAFLKNQYSERDGQRFRFLKAAWEFLATAMLPVSDRHSSRNNGLRYYLDVQAEAFDYPRHVF
jgi:hypothetical protein